MNLSDNNIEALWEQARSRPPLMEVSEIESLIVSPKVVKHPYSSSGFMKRLAVTALIVTSLGALYFVYKNNNNTLPEKQITSVQKNNNNIEVIPQSKNEIEEVSPELNSLQETPLHKAEENSKTANTLSENKIFKRDENKNEAEVINQKDESKTTSANDEDDKPKSKVSTGINTGNNKFTNSDNDVLKESSNQNYTMHGWKLKGPNSYSFFSGIDKEEHHSGNAAGFINAIKETYNSAWLTQQVDATRYAGKRIKMTAWVKTNNVGKKLWAGIFLSAEDGDKRSSFYDNLYEKKIKKHDEWNKCEIVADVPNGTRILKFGLYKVYAGKAWIDDINIEVVPENTPLAFKKNVEVSDTSYREPGLRDGVFINKKTVNTAFENGFEGTAPKGWFIDKEDLKYSIGIDDAMPHNGDGAAFLVAHNAGKNDWNSLSQIVRVGKYAGNRVRITGWLKSENLTDYASFWMRVDDYKSRGNMDVFHNRILTGNNNWKQMDIVLDIPPDANTLSFGVLLKRNGKIYLDDVSIEVVGQNFISNEIVKPHPVNLDFEE